MEPLIDPSVARSKFDPDSLTRRSQTQLASAEVPSENKVAFPTAPRLHRTQVSNQSAIMVLQHGPVTPGSRRPAHQAGLQFSFSAHNKTLQSIPRSLGR